MDHIVAFNKEVFNSAFLYASEGSGPASSFIQSIIKDSNTFENRGVQERFLHSPYDVGEDDLGMTVVISTCHWAGHLVALTLALYMAERGMPSKSQLSTTSEGNMSPDIIDLGFCSFSTWQKPHVGE